jgi:glyoxylase-like metal-dependent hydrolase (beta-lactamase superfamily II)
MPGILRIISGPVNGVLITRQGKTLAVYGDPRSESVAADTVLLTHHRRDVVWASRALIETGATVVGPAREAELLSGVVRFWSDFQEQRFHDYAQQTTKVLGSPVRLDQAVRGGETLNWQDLAIRVLDTPGYTRGSITYLMDVEDHRIAFTGDLLFDGGKLLDLYSLQDAVPEAGIGGYHGYAARLAMLIDSLRRVAAENPTIIIPSRGPVIDDPIPTIEKMIARIQSFYSNYLSIDALRWYFQDKHIRTKADRVLGPQADVQWMPMAETVTELPDWIVAIDNARLICSADKTGFLVDCGSQRIMDELQKLQTEGKLSSIEHIFVTHYHDDHTNHVSALAGQAGATVHASRFNEDILRNPSAYRMPCLTTHPIHVSGRASSGARWRWKEFEMALFYFPGQTLYHDALLVKKDGGEEVFFVGDSFTPSGIDDYCLLNRNFLHDDTGYFYCLDLVDRLAPQALLINQHVEPAFRFSADQRRQMRRTLEQRVQLLRDMLPWDDPNFGIDEGWARFYPYALQAHPGDTIQLSLRIMNHSPSEQEYRVRFRLPPGWTTDGTEPASLRIFPRQEGAIAVRIKVPRDAVVGNRLVTADLAWGHWELRDWAESLVTVIDAPPRK